MWVLVSPSSGPGSPRSLKVSRQKIGYGGLDLKSTMSIMEEILSELIRSFYAAFEIVNRNPNGVRLIKVACIFMVI